ncbi:hypothetical protein [Pseudoxanthomonas sacheonensis]|uniref:hypothetical protein n=1 Tax=Pseudoxanthomonas sacheonensis TaxID=443615 RepID=UPI0013D8606A|nr:hypothetical protein [Pseudoxanthomonas sacheonensis]
MNATRIPYAVSRALLALLTLACACTACSAPAPPAGDADSAPSESASAPSAPDPDTYPMEATVPDTPITETAAPTTASPAPTGAPAPPLPSKPKPTSPSKTPASPVPPPTSPITDAKDTQPVRITIDALSRGKGVPAETREAFKQIRALLERQQATSAVAAMRYQRIGIEGESRLCVEFRNASDAQAALTEIRKIAAGADLLNVVEAPCPSNKE